MDFEALIQKRRRETFARRKAQEQNQAQALLSAQTTDKPKKIRHEAEDIDKLREAELLATQKDRDPAMRRNSPLRDNDIHPQRKQVGQGQFKERQAHVTANAQQQHKDDSLTQDSGALDKLVTIQKKAHPSVQKQGAGPSRQSGSVDMETVTSSKALHRPVKRKVSENTTLSPSNEEELTEDDLFVPEPSHKSKRAKLSAAVKPALRTASVSAEPSETPSPEALQPKWAPPKKIGKRNKAIWTDSKTIDTSKEKRTNAKGEMTSLQEADWYNRIGSKEKFVRSDAQPLAYIRTLIQGAISARQRALFTAIEVTKLREQLHQAEFLGFLRSESGVTIKRSRILEVGGLPDIFTAPPNTFPKDVIADAQALYKRWVLGDWDPDLMRGIKIVKGKLTNGQKRVSYKLKSISEFPFRRSANVIGSNGLQNGAWFPNRVTAVRDGAHGEQEAGIAGQPGKGAFAICLAEGGYLDEDKGDSIEYCGTESKDLEPTRSTKLMLETALKSPPQPVRVLRAVNKKSEYAPSVGVRYDGLYDIVAHELVNEDTAMYRFSMRRRAGQDPIRYGQGEAARPTKQEMRELTEIRGIIGMTVT